MGQASNKQKMIQTAIGAVAAVIGYFLIQQLFNKPTVDEAIMEAASEINKSCPIMLDKDTRLDNVLAMPNNSFQYNYTLVNFEDNSIEVDELTDYLRPIIVNNIKTNPDMKWYRDNRVTFLYNYKDMNGVFILKLKVTPDEYED